EQHPERQLPLDVQVPRLRISQPAAIGIPGETAALDVGLRGIRRRVFVHARITIVPVECRLKIISIIHHIRNAPAETAQAGDAVRVSVIVVRGPVGKEDPVSAANHQLRSYLIGEAEPGSEVLIALTPESSLPGADGAVSCEIDRAWQARSGVDFGWVEIRQAVVLFGLHWVEIPAQSQVQSQPGADFEVVLHEGGERLVYSERGRSDTDAGVIDRAQQ